MTSRIYIFFFLLFFFSLFSFSFGNVTGSDHVNYRQYLESGIASWYGNIFHGETTANGETFDMEELTAAHRTLPFNTIVRVENKQNGKSVIVRINDRGPYADERVIDLSRKAAVKIGIITTGLAEVDLFVLTEGDS